MSLPEVLIFDWSGVISDDRLPVYEANMRLYEDHGLKRISFDEWLSQTKLSAGEIFDGKSIKVDREKVFDEYKQALAQVKSEGIHPTIYNNAKNTLKELVGMGKKLAIVSSHPRQALEEEARLYSVEKYFDLFVGDSKEKTGTLLEMCKKLNIAPSPSTVAYTGDTIYDIRAAKGAGVYSIAVTGGYHSRERLEKENPDKLVDGIAELI
jgi:phosphoglycolate phosphatase